jgi:UPF0755 protein
MKNMKQIYKDHLKLEKWFRLRGMKMPSVPRHQRRRLRKLIIPGLSAILIATIFFVYMLAFRSLVTEPVMFDLQRGMSVGALANDLAKDGVIDSPFAFKAVVKSYGGKVQAGIYDIPAKASIWKIASMMARGDIAATTIMIPEGTTVRQVVGMLEKNKFLRGQACEFSSHESQVASYDNIKPCPRDGELFPDTYRVSKGTRRSEVIEIMRRKKKLIEQGWMSGGTRLPEPLKTWEQAIALASIVQKETPKKEEMPLVAGVYLNRLRQGMRLQADPTVVYFITDRLGDMQGQPLLKSHLQTDHPYNTYTRNGLPPGAIANVGHAAIAAVFNPADTEYLFFVADGTGGHKFAKTYEEHAENVKVWRKIKNQR